MATVALAKLIEEFTEDLRTEKRRSPQTAANYTTYLRRFAQATGVRTPEDITAPTIEQFRAWLGQRGGDARLRHSTINYHLTALRTFLKYLHQREVTTLPSTAIWLQPTPRRTVTTLETPGLNRLLHYPLKLEGRSILQHRDRAILELLCSTGLRVGEISRLRRESLASGGSELAVTTRGGKLRIMPLGNQARYWMSQYLKLRQDTAPQLFIRHDPAARGRPKGLPTPSPKIPAGLTPRSMQRLVKKYAAAAGLGTTVKPRTLRHTVAANLIAAGNDLETVRQRLGHASVASTKIYLRRKP